MKSRMGPRVSIGLPVYNGERYIEETLNSLLVQTYEDFELIICDNDSGDRTQEICQSYAAKDRRIRYVRNPTNLGAAKNYSLTFELSSGEYFRWATCDDLFAPTSLERCVEVLDRELSTILVYPKTKLIDERGQIISEYDDGLHLQSSRASERFISALGVDLVNVIYGLIRAASLRKTAMIGNFIGADTALIAELALYGKFWEIPEFLFYRRIHGGAYSQLKSIDQQQNFFDPNTRGQVAFTQWRYFWARSRAVSQAPISIAEKLRLVVCLMHSAYWRHAELTGEIITAMRQTIRKSV
jgi:glycosyltransferase involved in cell wall biosynthesis